jgi:succinate dehydrogenase / fumarate reductase flavoprotein subunit
MSGKVEAITASAVIVPHRGWACLSVHDQCGVKTGDGCPLPIAGAPLKDMEFVQYHPTTLLLTGILITRPRVPKAGT